jgi:hypothetical protein
MLVAILLGLVLTAMAGCDGGAPTSGSRAIVAEDHLDKQRVKIEQYRASLKPRPYSKSAVRR